MKLLHTEEGDWKGVKHKVELYESEVLPDGYISQCQAVPFVDDKHIVLYKHAEGYYGLPGGTVEEGEDYDTTLTREVREESACEVVDSQLIGYVKDTEVLSCKVKYQLRYWAKVKLLDEPISDPAGKAIGREVVEFEEAGKLLGWGERWQVLFDLARSKYLESGSNTAR